ncbi:MAG: glycosyltransferase family 39 protein [Candidatus Moranbacteria bacterium]|nr:glycosyltransferase family 39 protein [Candidatus Moranbacteria bacterium]
MDITKKIYNLSSAAISSKKIKKSALILTIVIIFGAFLRFYDFGDLARFNADQVRDAQIIDEIRDTGDFPLLGPKAGGTGFKLGPMFYYLEYLSGSIFGFSPQGIALFIPILSTISIGLFYLVFRNIFSINLALLLTFLYSISFYFVKYSRFAWNPNVIPFFILSFILLLFYIDNRRQNNFIYYILLGFVMGIGIQLHTTLLILMPVTLLFFMIFYFIKNKNLPLKKMILSIAIVGIFNIPFLYSDYLNKGKNIEQFFAGTQVKTGSSSLIENIANTGQFFAQGSAYSILGTEPKRNWTNVRKFINSRDMSEYALCLSSLLVLIIGIFLFIRKIQNNKSERASRYIILMIISASSLLIFLPMGNELNLRFFITILFLPYLLLGIILEYALERFNFKITKIFIVLLIVMISITNLDMFYKAYNLNDYRLRESVYGGISLGELESICLEMGSAARKKDSDQNIIYAGSIKSKRSVEYICQKKGIEIRSFDAKSTPFNSLVFILVDIKNEDKNKSLNKDNFSFIESKKIGRYSLMIFIYNKKTETI